MAITIEKIAAKPMQAAPVAAPAVGDDPLVTVVAFATVVFGAYDKRTIKKVRRLIECGALKAVKLGRAPKPGKKDNRRVHIPLHSGRARLMESGGAS